MFEGGDRDIVSDSLESGDLPLGITIDEHDEDNIFRMREPRASKGFSFTQVKTGKDRKSELDSALRRSAPESRPKSMADSNSIVSGRSTEIGKG